MRLEEAGRLKKGDTSPQKGSPYIWNSVANDRNRRLISYSEWWEDRAKQVEEPRRSQAREHSHMVPCYPGASNAFPAIHTLTVVLRWSPWVIMKVQYVISLSLALRGEALPWREALSHRNEARHDYFLCAHRLVYGSIWMHLYPEKNLKTIGKCQSPSHLLCWPLERFHTGAEPISGTCGLICSSSWKVPRREVPFPLAPSGLKSQ